MPGVKGRSGPPEVPKSEDHRAKIAAAMKAYWSSDEGRRERAMRREINRMARLERRKGGQNGGQQTSGTT